MIEASRQRTYTAGELAPVSGIYRVLHPINHRSSHEALIIRGEQLPACRTCGPSVRFEVVRNLSHVTHEWDFAGPQGLMVSLTRRDPRDLRQWPRYEVELPVEIRPQSRGALRGIEGRTSNISEGGLNATFSTLISGAESLELEIRVPDWQMNLIVNAQLRHVNGNKHGFEFVQLDREAKRKLRSAIESLNS